MSDIACLFPGQGAQAVGMGKDFYDASPTSRDVFEKASDILGYDIADLCFNGPKEELDRTDRSQVALLTVAMACFNAIKESGMKISINAGLSLGEFSALVAAGSIRFEDALQLVEKRGRLMQEASEKIPGAMSAVIGLEESVLKEVAQQTGVELANFNSPGQIVISGRIENIDEAEKLAKGKGAKKVVRLAVSGAFHCSLLREAQEKLNKYIDEVDICNPETVFFSSITGDVISDSEQIRAALKRQLVSPTLWQAAMENMKKNTKLFIEAAPAGIIKAMMRRVDKTAVVVAVNSVSDIEGIIARA